MSKDTWNDMSTRPAGVEEIIKTIEPCVAAAEGNGHAEPHFTCIIIYYACTTKCYNIKKYYICIWFDDGTHKTVFSALRWVDIFCRYWVFLTYYSSMQMVIIPVSSMWVTKLHLLLNNTFLDRLSLQITDLCKLDQTINSFLFS
jgi:hypothetical protein